MKSHRTWGSKGDPESLPLYWASNAISYSSDLQVRKSRFSSFASLLIFIFHRPREKLASSCQHQKLRYCLLWRSLGQARAWIVTANCSEWAAPGKEKSNLLLSSDQELNMGRSQQYEGNKQKQGEFPNCWCLGKLTCNNSGYVNVSLMCVLI